MAVRKSACLCLLLAACSAREPIPSGTFDGLYTGSRSVNDTRACGVQDPTGRTSASIRHGRVTVHLFGPQTVLEGNVDESGWVRASGMWENPTHGFPFPTTLTGTIHGREMDANATDYRCEAHVHLARQTRPDRLPEPPLPPHKRFAKRAVEATRAGNLHSARSDEVRGGSPSRQQDEPRSWFWGW